MEFPRSHRYILPSGESVVTSRAVMITEALKGFRSLDDMVREWEANGWPSCEVKRRIFESVAQVLNVLHARRVQHSSLYPKHIFDTTIEPVFGHRISAGRAAY